MEIMLAVSAFLILQTLWKYLFRTKQSTPTEEPFVPKPFTPNPEFDAKMTAYFQQVNRNLEDMAEKKRRLRERERSQS